MTTQALTVFEPNQMAIVTRDPQEIREILAANIGPSGLDVTQLTTVKMAAGGIPAWKAPTLEDPDNTEKAIQGVAIHWTNVRAWWEKPFGSGDQTPPDCFSTDGVWGQGRSGWTTTAARTPPAPVRPAR
jgi:hypothetical protein